MTREKPKNLWLSRWGFILAATGSAVGLCNIWKFPYITGEYGGGAFVLMYLACILAIGIPVMMTEIAIGRRGRGSPIDAIGRVVKENGRNPLWKAVGGMAMLAGFMILCFYVVVAGWAFAYTVKMLDGSLAATSVRSEEHTSELQSHSNITLHFFFFNDPATTEIYPLSLHDALPILFLRGGGRLGLCLHRENARRLSGCHQR